LALLSKHAETRRNKNLRHHLAKARMQAMVSASNASNATLPPQYPSTKVPRCAIRANPSCDTVSDKLMLMQRPSVTADGRIKCEFNGADSPCCNCCITPGSDLKSSRQVSKKPLASFTPCLPAGNVELERSC
jgi:hypothetical protein